MLTAKDKSYFLSRIDRLRELDENASPIWGMMSPQHMVEHIVGSWRISNGRARIPVMLEGDELELRRTFLFSELAYERNIKNPTASGTGLAKLRKPSLSAAIDQLEDEMIEFFKYHEANPSAEENHPVFGVLDFDSWLLFQTKHMGHHLAQFGID